MFVQYLTFFLEISVGQKISFDIFLVLSFELSIHLLFELFQWNIIQANYNKSGDNIYSEIFPF